MNVYPRVGKLHELANQRCIILDPKASQSRLRAGLRRVIERSLHSL